MNKWHVKISKEAEKDYDKIDGSVKKQVLAGIVKVSKAPLPAPDGYGKPLGNKGSNNCYDMAARLYEKHGDKIFTDIFGSFID